MAAITIRNIDPEIKERLRVRAAQNGRSMEEEVRNLINRELKGINGGDLFKLSRQLFSGENGIDLEIPPRGDNRPDIDFSDY
jgi:antitoxin FitA